MDVLLAGEGHRTAWHIQVLDGRVEGCGDGGQTVK